MDKAEYPEEMVCVPMGDENGIDRKSAPGPHHLLLCPLSTVKKERVRTAPDQDAGRITPGCWKRPGGSKKVNL